MFKPFYHMPKIYSLSVLLLSVLSVQPILAEQATDDGAVESNAPAEVVAALQNTKIAERGDYAFTKKEKDKDKERIERFDPRSEPEWTLLLVNGQEPNQEEQEKYQNKKSERKQGNDQDANSSNEENEEEKSFSFDFENPDSIAEQGTWNLLESDDPDLLIYGFKPKIESKEDRKFLPFVDGKLVIDKNSNTVKSYQLSNSRPFKPVVVAKIYTFNMHIDFSEIDKQVYYPSLIHVKVDGKAMFKRFQENNRIEFSDFEKVGTSSATGGAE